MVTPYFAFTCAAGKLSKVHIPSSAHAGAATAEASRLANSTFRFMVLSLRGGCGLALGSSAATAILGEDVDQFVDDGREIRHLTAQLADEAVGIHVFALLARQMNDA